MTAKPFFAAFHRHDGHALSLADRRGKRTSSRAGNFRNLHDRDGSRVIMGLRHRKYASKACSSTLKVCSPPTASRWSATSYKRAANNPLNGYGEIPSLSVNCNQRPAPGIPDAAAQHYGRFPVHLADHPARESRQSVVWRYGGAVLVSLAFIAAALAAGPYVIDDGFPSLCFLFLSRSPRFTGASGLA